MRKRLFIGLLAVSLVFIFLATALAWWIVSRRGLMLNKIILTALIAFAIVAFLGLVAGFIALVWSIWYSKNTPFLQLIIYRVTNILFPLALVLGKWFGLNEDRIKQSFIQVSNHLAKTGTRAHPKKKIMVLAPHCLQWKECPYKITIDSSNCKECGKCPVAGLLRLTRRCGVDLWVVTGGTFARKVIMEQRPEAVVAIACERDLTSGIQDVGSFPIIGIVNERPEGPCSNTRVNLEKVEEAIKIFQEGGLS